MVSETNVGHSRVGMSLSLRLRFNNHKQSNAIKTYIAVKASDVIWTNN